MKLILSYLLSPIFFALLGLWMLFMHLFQLVALLFGYKSHKFSVKILNLGIVGLTKILCTKYRYNGFEKLDKNKRYLFICNHQSSWETPPLMIKLAPFHMKFIAKKELSKFIPSVSINLKKGGSLLIDRSKGTESRVQIEEYAKTLKAKGFSVLIFPEGTRGKKGELGKFRSGGIKSILNGYPDINVVPIAINGSWKFTKYGVFPKSFGETIEYTVLDDQTLSTIDLEMQLVDIKQLINEKLE